MALAGKGLRDRVSRSELAQPVDHAGRIEEGVHFVNDLLDIERDLDSLSTLPDTAKASATFAMPAALSRSARISVRYALLAISIVRMS